MHRKHSSDSDDVPLDSYKASNSLHLPNSLPCEFCDHISTSIYANFKHNATHIIIPLVNLTLHQCEDCLQQFTSIEELSTHAKVKNHCTSQVPLKSDYDIILQSIINKQLVVKCRDLFNDIKQNSEISQNSAEVSKETNSENDSAVSKTNISHVIVKTEVPTYVISDSDSYGRNSPVSDTDGQRMKKEESCKKLEVFKTKPERIAFIQPENVTENLPRCKGEQSLPHMEGRSDSPLHRKWQHLSDSDIDLDASISEESKMKFYRSDEEITEIDQSIFKYTTIDGKSSPERKSSPVYEPIRSRLVFEDDLDDDIAEEILSDIPCRLVANKCLLGTAPSTNFKPNSIILGSQTNGIQKSSIGNGVTGIVNNLKISDMRVEKIDREKYPESVPYEMLVQEGICDCKYCGRCFSNRLQLVSHETTHMRIRKPRPTLCVYCERFFAGNYRTLRKHMEAKHPDIDLEEKRPQTQVCKTCHLHYYKFTRHVRYYHKQQQENSQQVVYRKDSYKTLKVCDMCLQWCKNDNIYNKIGTHSEVGRTQKCCKCHNRHYSINLVTRRVFGYNVVSRSMSNEERLIRIKRKLNMIKKMNKCFCSCFI